MAVPSLVLAHQRLLRTTPASDATLTEVPGELRLVFAEPVQLAFTRLELVGPDGIPIELGSLTVAPDSTHVLIAPVAGRLGAGAHVVRWSTASLDGHPVRGEFSFAVAPDATGLTPPDAEAVEEEDPAVPPLQPTVPPPTPAPTAFGVESPGFVVIRWVQYLSLLVLLGAVAFARLVLPRASAGTAEPATMLAASGRRSAWIGVIAAGLLVAVAFARLYAQSLALHGPQDALDSSALGALLGTAWGTAWLLQVVGAAVAVIALLTAGRGAAAGWWVAAASALVLSLTPALSGHAAAMQGTLGTMAVIADAIHVVGAGGWLGTLFVLLVAGLPVALRLGGPERGAAVREMVAAFSPAALFFAGLLVLTGTFATIVHGGSFSALVASDYGRLLFLKLGVFVVVVALGAYNFRRLRPSLGSDPATSRLRRSASLELGFGAVVLLITAMLVATARPYEEVTHHTGTAVHPTNLDRGGGTEHPDP